MRSNQATVCVGRRRQKEVLTGRQLAIRGDQQRQVDGAVGNAPRPEAVERDLDAGVRSEPRKFCVDLDGKVRQPSRLE
jgi:hypothetical protein